MMSPSPNKPASRWLLAAVVAGIAAASPAHASPSVYPTGVTVYDPLRAYNSDVLFNGADHKTYLIDMDGTVVHRWNYDGFPSKIIDPALVGGAKGVIGTQLSAVSALLVASKLGASGVLPGAPPQYRNEEFGFIDWDGKVLWQWGKQAPDSAALQHHDWTRLPDGHVLILSNTAHKLPGFGDRQMVDDVIYEVDVSGKIVWSWTPSDHLDEFGFSPAQLEMVRHTPEADFLHVNAMSALGPNRWAEGGDSRFAPGNIMISSRDANVVAIIDRATGKVVWRLGPDYPMRGSEYKAEATPRPVDQVSGQHDPQMIPEGLPGAGNVLLLDNQGEAGFPPVRLQVSGGSRVLEINPKTMEVVWQYAASNSDQAGWTFHTPFIGSVQRLPNGNTLIDEGTYGRFFQVTPGGDIVWEYISPVTGVAPPAPLLGHGLAKSNWVYRCQAVLYDWLPDSSHAEIAVHAPSPAAFRIPTGPGH